MQTAGRTQLLDVTAGVARLVRDSGVLAGTSHLYVPHTTAGVTINQNADPDVALDIATALERIAPGLPMKPGKVERCEFEYRRHGTQTLSTAFDVVTSRVQGVVGDIRTEADYFY